MPPLEPHEPPTREDFEELIAPLATGGERRPVAVMVASIDGRATSHGRVGPLTGEADQWLLLGVREQAEALLIGAATLRAEGYGRLLPDEARSRRRRQGRSPEPHLYVLARDLDALSDAAALGPEGPAATILRPPQAAASPALPEHVRTEPIPQLADRRADLNAVVAFLRRRHPRGLIATEGGPTLLGMLVEQRALGGLVLAVSPRLEGGAEKRLLESAAQLGIEARLLGAAVAGGFAFLRYALPGDPIDLGAPASDPGDPQPEPGR